jgi:hypothetical protein
MEFDRELDNRRLAQRADHKSEMRRGGSVFPIINSGGRAREFPPVLVQSGRGRKSHSVLNRTFSLPAGNLFWKFLVLIRIKSLSWRPRFIRLKEYFCRAKMRQLWLAYEKSRD